MRQKKINNTKQVSAFDQLKQQTLDAISYFDIKSAREAAKELEFQIKKLSEKSGSEKEIQEYSSLLIRLKLLTLPLLRDEEANRLVKEKAIELLTDSDLDLAERIETRQLTLPELLRYETVNLPLIEAIHQNLEIIGNGKIFVSGNPEAEAPTVANWLLDYDRTYGTQPQSDLVWLEYVNSGENASRLNAKEKEILRKLLKLYEFLKVEHVVE